MFHIPKACGRGELKMFATRAIERSRECFPA
jgi:hypothetical protein